MEQGAPKYWENPEIISDAYVSKTGGAQGTNAIAGTAATGHVHLDTVAAAIAMDSAHKLALNLIGNTGNVASTGSAASTSA
jgi:multidrug efflux pump